MQHVVKRIQWALSGVGLIAIGYFIGAATDHYPPALNVTAQDATEIILSQHEQLLGDLYARLSPSIVAINIIDTTRGDVGGGSGFVLDTEGHLVTNFHVVDEVGSDNIIEVEFFDGTIARAEIVAHDLDSDLGLLRVDLPAERLIPAPLGDSDALKVGQLAVAIGSPFGQDWTLTSGIISALNRDIRGLGSFRIGAVIQTDAAINPGNSGGPLLNMRGEVIGINTQIFSPERANSGVGFAVPINLARRVIGELVADGRVDYAYLGVFFLEDVNLQTIERLGLPNNTRGVLVTSLEPGGPAANSGLLQDDIILAVDGEPITNFASLIGYLGTNTLPDQIVKLTVLRAGQTLNLDVRLGQRP
jgi:2-alkenal reductase